MLRSLSFLVLVFSLLVSGPALARKPEDVFGGRILLSDKPFPTNARSAEAYIDAVKRQSKERIDEDKPNKQWRIFFAAFFKTAVNDLEVTIKIYDVTKGQPRMVDSFEQYLSDTKQRAYLSELKLEHGDGIGGYEPNSKLHVVIEGHGKVVAEATVFIAGEVTKYKGKVDFSEDDGKK